MPDIKPISKNRIPFLNIHINNLTRSDAVEELDKLIGSEGYHYIVSVNSDDVVKTARDSELQKICDEAALVLTDGQMLIYLSRWLEQPIRERLAMTDFVWDVFKLAQAKGYRVFLLGGKKEALKKAEENIGRKIGRAVIAGSYSPPLGFEKDKRQVDKINEMIRASGADILLVFLGCPKQNRFIYYNKDKYCVPVSITMGGCVDFLAGNVKRAPLWMQKRGLEWFYRFLQEPSRLFKRYFVEDIYIFKMAYAYKHDSKAYQAGRY